MARKQTINRNLSLEEVVEVLITKCLDALEKKKLKVTVSDLIRIRDLREKLAPTEPLPEVTWIDGWD